MLNNTLILPETDSRLAVQLLRDAIHKLDVVLMLVLGKDDRAHEIVQWADQLCVKTATPDGNLRKVVWIRALSTATMTDALHGYLGDGPLPRVAVFNFFDEVKATLTEQDTIDPVTLELAFLKGHKA
jgi:hypothetical protein